MNVELLLLALAVGAANWAFRAVPILARTDRLVAGGWVERFLSATGPAAIATLVVASTMPYVVTPEMVRLIPAVVGMLAVVGVWVVRRSVVLATLAGAVAHGFGFWLMG